MTFTAYVIHDIHGQERTLGALMAKTLYREAAGSCPEIQLLCLGIRPRTEFLLSEA